MLILRTIKFLEILHFFEVLLPQRILRIFSPISPPTQGVGGSNSELRVIFNEKSDALNILSIFKKLVTYLSPRKSDIFQN